MTFSRLLVMSLAAFFVAGSAVAAQQRPISNACTTASGNISGEAALSAGDQAKARRGPVEAACWYQKAADRGNAVAQRKLGLLYLNGEGVAQDLTVAAKLFGQAAAQGDIDAIDDLAALYQTGQGVTKNHAEAMRLWRIAAARGDSWAKESMAKSELEEAALGVPNLANADPCHAKPGDFKVETELFSAEKALNAGQNRIGACWMRLAAEAGHHSGQQGMGLLFASGKGVDVNFDFAFYWFLQSAKQGDADAIYDLGKLADNGQGMPKNHDLAVALWRLAAKRGNYEAQGLVNKESLRQLFGIPGNASDEEVKGMLLGKMTEMFFALQPDSGPVKPLTREEKEEIERDKERDMANAHHDWWERYNRSHP